MSRPSDEDVKARTEASEVARQLKVKETVHRTGTIPPDSQTVIAVLRTQRKR